MVNRTLELPGGGWGGQPNIVLFLGPNLGESQKKEPFWSTTPDERSETFVRKIPFRSPRWLHKKDPMKKFMRVGK